MVNEPGDSSFTRRPFSGECLHTPAHTRDDRDVKACPHQRRKSFGRPIDRPLSHSGITIIIVTHDQTIATDRDPGRRWKGGGLMNTQTPSGDVSVTALGCAACGQPLPASRFRRFCSPACRQAAFRLRHQSAVTETPLQPRLHGWKAPSTNARSARPEPAAACKWCCDCSHSTPKHGSPSTSTPTWPTPTSAAPSPTSSPRRKSQRRTRPYFRRSEPRVLGISPSSRVGISAS